MANVIQMATHYRVGEPSSKFIPGDVAMAGQLILPQSPLEFFTEWGISATNVSCVFRDCLSIGLC